MMDKTKDSFWKPTLSTFRFYVYMVYIKISITVRTRMRNKAHYRNQSNISLFSTRWKILARVIHTKLINSLLSGHLSGAMKRRYHVKYDFHHNSTERKMYHPSHVFLLCIHQLVKKYDYQQEGWMIFRLYLSISDAHRCILISSGSFMMA